MDETKEIEFSKILDLVYTTVDFDFFDEQKYLSAFRMKDPRGEYDSLIYFYGYSLNTPDIWFYEDICIRDNKLYMGEWFIEKWIRAKCERKDFQLGSLKKLIEVQYKKLEIINIGIN